MQVIISELRLLGRYPGRSSLSSSRSSKSRRSEAACNSAAPSRGPDTSRTPSQRLRAVSAAGRGSQVEKMAPFLDLDNLKPFVDLELANSTKPIVFQVPTGTRAYGYKAELLPKVCEVYLEARDAGCQSIERRMGARKTYRPIKPVRSVRDGP